MLSLNEEKYCIYDNRCTLPISNYFCVLWQHTVHDQTDFTTLAQAEANKAYTSFSRPIKKVGMTATMAGALLRFMRSKEAWPF